MSDYFRNQPNQQDSFQTGKAQGREDWPEMPVWQQSEMLNGLDDAGMTMQQGGVPLYGAGGDFLTEGDNAPTRIGKPISQQLLNRRAAPESGVEPAAQSAPRSAGEQAAPVRRRRSRVAERAREQAVAPAVNEYDPFSAGDSEVEPQPAERRAAAPGGRYTGARTAMPESRPAAQGVASRARETRDQMRTQMDAETPAQRLQRPARPLQAPHGRVRVEGDDEHVAFFGTRPEVRLPGGLDAAFGDLLRRRLRALGIRRATGDCWVMSSPTSEPITPSPFDASVRPSRRRIPKR